MKTFIIESKSDITDFISFLYSKTKEMFDPAENITELMDSYGKLIFDQMHGDYYEDVMNQCFIFCVFNKINIDKLANSVFSVSQVKLAA